VLPAAVVETHVSVLFFTADRVFKLLKPVDMGFLNHVDRTRRLAATVAELELNRRLAPDVYLGLADIREADELVDQMVVMRRLPDDRRMSSLAGTPGFDDHVRSVAKAVASFHAAQPPAARTGMATRDAVAKNWADNLAVMERNLGKVLAPDVFDEVALLAARYLDLRVDLFDDRIRKGWVRDGHGDLLADDIFCLDDGPRILDCLAFNEDLRIADVLCDIGFLAMDLLRLVGPAAADALLTWYQDFTGERHPSSLAHHYIAYRAGVRAKVACLRYEQGDAASAEHARTYLELCRDELRRGEVQLVLVGGGAGVGKSTLAEGLAERMGWCRLNTDEIRKDVLRVAHATRIEAAPGQGPYDDQGRATVYLEMLWEAGRLLAHGESVVLDASWNDAAQRDRAADLARATGSRLTELDCQLDLAVARERIARRQASPFNPSDATPAIAEHLAATGDPWPSATAIDMRAAPDDLVDAALAVLTRLAGC
jgi:uncharacterized protein